MNAIDEALALPPEQRVHALAGLLDAIAELGYAEAVLRPVDQHGIAHFGLDHRVAVAVTARLRRDLAQIVEVVEDQARAASSDGGHERTACLVLVAPLLATTTWRRVPIAALPPVIPLAPREIVRDAVDRAMGPEAELATLFVCAAAFLDAPGLESVRRRVVAFSHTAHRRTVEVALATTGRLPAYFASDTLTLAAQRWWMTEAAAACVRTMQLIAANTARPRPATYYADVQIAAELRDLVRTLARSVARNADGTRIVAVDVPRGGSGGSRDRGAAGARPRRRDPVRVVDDSIPPAAGSRLASSDASFEDDEADVAADLDDEDEAGVEDEVPDASFEDDEADPEADPDDEDEAVVEEAPGASVEQDEAAVEEDAAAAAGAFVGADRRLPYGSAWPERDLGFLGDDVYGSARPERDLGFIGDDVHLGKEAQIPAEMADLPARTVATRRVPPPAIAEPEPRREVSIGLAPDHAAAEPIVDHCLAADTTYWLWIEIAASAVVGGVPGPHAVLPTLGASASIDVVLFTEDGELEISEHARRGCFELQGSQSVVTEPAARPPSAAGLGDRRLFFVVHTPNRRGAGTVRVNLYHEGTLLQSHLVTAQIEPVARAWPGGLARTLDYAVTSQLALARFAAMPSPQLSILAHHEPTTGTHGFQFYSLGEAGRPLVAQASLDGAALAPMIEFARRALRIAAWGTTDPWRSHTEHPYRYAAPTTPQLAADLISLARHGARLWSEALIAFGLHARQRDELRDLLRRPGALQLALQDGPRHVFPVALVYDHPIDSNRDDLEVCPRFLADLAAAVALLGTPCFRGACPHLADKRIVCPSGFWGFRHEVGVAPHLRGREIATEVGVREPGMCLLVAMVSTDPTLVGRAGHLEALARLPGLATVILDERQHCLDALEAYEPEIGYFYCHGGVTAAGTPYLEVGPRGSDMITSDNFVDLQLSDTAPRTLVVLNGCHTAATTPELAFDLVSGFLCHANASGVVGTEITIFEPLAHTFGQALIASFIGGATLGAAVRQARLMLLAQRNPLGLAYIPFGLPELALDSSSVRPRWESPLPPDERAR